ncbi:MAG: ribonuclease T [Pseudomonadota bacterium]
MDDIRDPLPMSKRFRGFLPVVVDVETGGFNDKTDALLEIAAVLIEIQEDGSMLPGEQIHTHVEPFQGANIDPASLEITGIDPSNPLRGAIPEQQALGHVFQPIRQAVRDNDCNRAILVGHNSFFDLSFINAAVERNGIKRNPFHPFSSFDTATLAGVLVGQTVLSRAVEAVGLAWDSGQAHGAAYDANVTANLFCELVNRSASVYGLVNEGKKI